MRATLFLSSLFAVTLVAGAALADKPEPAAPPAKAPRVLERLRAHGDVVDKAQRGSVKVVSDDGVQAASPQRAGVPKPRLKGESRVLCSETGIDCAKPGARHDQKAAPGEAPAKADANRGAQPPAFLAKILGSDRMQCNEADECAMSSRAAKRAWSRAGGGGESPADERVKKDSPQKQAEMVRTRRSAPTDRVACNEADECMMSSKAAKKVWAYEAVKAGSWSGPDAKSKTPAEKAIENAKKK